MRFAWVGFHAEGVSALDALLEAGAPVQGVITLRPDLAAKRSGGADYFPVCVRRGVPLHHITDINGPEATRILQVIRPDVVFVIGWHQIIREPALALAKVGMVGAHASLLPHNRGSAPINWAIINGEKETGNSLIWLAPDVDAGDLIDQRAFPISLYDTCATLYQQVAVTNRDMLLALLPRLMAGERPGRPQPRTEEPVLRRRRPADGAMDWEQPASRIYDFVRALTRPYPGAFSNLDGRCWKIWRASFSTADGEGRRPGEILGAALSPDAASCGQVVACAGGVLTILEIESDDGQVLSGPRLAEQRWTGKRFHANHPAGVA
ncbi:MAG TPA: methionyl-tRNA formyltransferase [Gemmatimonadales bacterium]|jgi:methionyl-tRNA formyltransferase